MHMRAGVVAAITCGWLFLAGSAQGAFIFDLRFSDGAKTKTVAANTSYTLQLWGQISNAPGNPFENDAIVYAYFSLDPVKQGAGAFYNPSDLSGSSGVGVTAINLTVKPRTGPNEIGLQRTGYADNVRGWGGNSGATATVAGWVKTDCGTYTDQLTQGFKQGWVMGAPYIAVDPDTGDRLYLPVPGEPTAGKSQQVNATTWEVLLGQLTVKTGASVNLTGNPASDKTLFRLRVQPKLRSGTVDIQTIGYYQDDPRIPSGAPSPPLNMTTGNVQGQDTFVTFAAVPESTTIVLLATWAGTIAGIFWLRRRRRTGVARD
jgi:hypothetical protein